jgi:hypothetical protein
MKQIIIAAVLLFSLNAYAKDEIAELDRAYGFAVPSGAWLLTVEFPTVPNAPPPPPAFKETLTLHPLGTASESNTLLNENSYNPALGMGCGFTGPNGALELNCNGSDGTGSWRRTGRQTISFVIVKFAYDGITNEHVGYLRVSSKRAVIRGNQLIQESDSTLTEFLVGTDLNTAVPIPLGGADSVGYRIQ